GGADGVARSAAADRHRARSAPGPLPAARDDERDGRHRDRVLLPRSLPLAGLSPGRGAGVVKTENKIVVEALIPAPVEVVWERSQEPVQHVAWDLRFTTIDYLP